MKNPSEGLCFRTTNCRDCSIWLVSIMLERILILCIVQSLESGIKSWLSLIRFFFLNKCLLIQRWCGKLYTDDDILSKTYEKSIESSNQTCYSYLAWKHRQSTSPCQYRKTQRNSASTLRTSATSWFWCWSPPACQHSFLISSRR